MVTDLAAEEGQTRSAGLPETAGRQADAASGKTDNGSDAPEPADAATGAADAGPQTASDKSDAGAEATIDRRATHGRALTILAAVAVLVLVIDVITKQLVVSHLREGEPVKVLGGLFYFTLIRNGGAAFSMGTSHTYIFPLVTLAVVAWIIWMATKLRSLPWAVSLGLVLGGAFGNLADRLFRAPGPFEGHVVDFISFLSPDGSHFAIFNAADSALTCGVILAVLLEVSGRRRDGSRVQNSRS
jgi:signal peptidase II